jgi:hypothetical protein
MHYAEERQKKALIYQGAVENSVIENLSTEGIG